MAYNHFIERFQASYEKCCPVKKVRVDVNNGCIKVKDRVCFAPVFITYNKLYMYNYPAMVKSKLSKSIAIMRKAKHLFDRRSGMILYFSLFLPYLSYCCEVWGNTYS